MPDEEGGYWMQCMENKWQSEFVPVYRKGGSFYCRLDSLAGAEFPLRSVHAALTDVWWAPAISVTQNAKCAGDGREADIPSH